MKGDVHMLPDISDEAYRILLWIVFGTLGQIITLFGTVANVINIICFVKQGFKDSINISLLGLAIADLGCLITLMMTNVCFTPAFQESSVPVDTASLQYGTTGWIHIVLTRITSCITAFITIERCLCITMPLKVKKILTPKRVTIIVVSIFIVLLASVAPVYYANRLSWVFSPRRNRTILGLVYTHDRVIVEQYFYSIVNTLVPLSSFIIIIICTITLVVQLHSKAKWRLKSACVGTAHNLTERDQKVTKMVVMISGLFIACFIPLCFLFIAMVLVPELSIDGKYKNTAFVISGILTLFQAVNSSVNIFIYYQMSSRYRTVLWQFFLRGRHQ